jgi:putative MATE family efflux protein
MKFIRKDILGLTIPILTEQAFMTVMGMVNTIMAGRLGKEAVSAVGMVDSLNNIFIGFFSALAVGGTVVVAQYSGRGNGKKANEAAKQALYCGVMIAFVVTISIWVFKQPLIRLLFGSAEKSVINATYSYLGITLFTYPLIAILLVANGLLRGTGDTKTPAKITISMNALNVLFSYVLIYGINIGGLGIKFSGLGIIGAALGIALARVVGAGMVLLALIRGSNNLKLRNVTKFKFERELLIPVVSIGIPASIESLLFSIGKLITQIYIVSLGTVAIASNSISGSIAGMINVPGAAFSIAATTIVGQRIGKGKAEDAQKSLMYLTYLSIGCLTLLGLLSIPFAPYLAELYNKDLGVIELSSKVIRMNGIFIIAWSFSFILPAGLRGAGDVKYTMFTSIAGMWLFRITLGYVLSITFGIGLIGVWLAMYIDWIVRGTMYFLRVKGGKWKYKAVIKTA